MKKRSHGLISVFVFPAALLMCSAIPAYAAETFSDILITDTFETHSIGPLPATGNWSEVQPATLRPVRRLEIMADTNNVMGVGTSNQILFFQNIAAQPWKYFVWIAADGLPASSALKVSFDFYEPSTRPGGLSVYAGAPPFATNAVNAFRLTDGAVEPAGSYSIDAPHHLDVLFNETGSTLDYDDPASAVSTLGNGLMDIWIDGTRVAAGATLDRDGSPAPAISSLLLTSVVTNQEIYLDNIVISRPEAPPEPELTITNLTVSGGTTQLEWNLPTERFIVIGAADLDGMMTNGLCVASATTSTNAAGFPYDDSRGFFRLMSGIAALDGISSPALIAAIKEQSTASAPGNRIYDTDTAGIFGLDIPGRSFSTDELVSLVNLQSLSIADSDLTTVSDFSFLDNLTWLNLSSNLLTDTAELDTLTNLEALDLQYNLISDLSGIEPLIHLRWLDLEHNQITNLSSVVTNAANGGLGAGDELWARDNPLSAAATNQIVILQTNYLINVYY